ncbi:double-strand break repair protein AddB [Sphingomonas radiodurans]|uniref:double-strand break repair protein AddB n=1 Tax=Sphingomonas radiodurans TaxID=2890321 RepID=UPI001E5565AA|nr:double-strand break repair protein AddB [Sphingomonas radiodurans]WBH16615.1 double-strand break repair protein AddB [Sphingomonas radiodurans]
MAERRGAGSRSLGLFTIPAHRAFADALVAGLIRRFGGEPLGLARGLVLLPNNRAKLAVTSAFVRASGGALVLPRLVAIGADDLGEAIGVALDPADAPDPPPPAVTPLARRMILARLVQEARPTLDAAEAVRLAGELARTLDQLIVEEVESRALADLDLGELTEHWRSAVALFQVVIDRWPGELARLGRIDVATRRSMLLRRLADRWWDAPPGGFVCAAGITDAAPSVAAMLARVAELPNGLVVLAGLDRAMPDAEWDALGPHSADPVTGRTPRSIEVHPQFHLKQLLARMGLAREDAAIWPDGSDHDASAARGRAIATALAPADFTARWTELRPQQRQLVGVRVAELATPAEEAQAIAIALRQAIEVPDRTAALVTPDRALARRVSAHCARWGIEVDDTAGRPLSITPPGTLLIAIVEAAAEDFAPLALLTLLKHPLVRAGEARGRWLEAVRRLDRLLRGPRPGLGLDGIEASLGEKAGEWWREMRDLLDPLRAVFVDGVRPLSVLVAGLRDAASALAGDDAWRGPAGRAAADLLGELEAEAPAGPRDVVPRDLGPLLRLLMDEVAIRPLQGGHPRLAIYGLIEARLQSADLMILGGLNEGVWPASPAPDPWLAPRIRAALGLPGLERAIGVAAHDFGQGLGAPAVLITRARRDARSPAIPSRLWLRLAAMAGDEFDRARDDELQGWARLIDNGGTPQPAARPAPRPSAALRPREISVTQVDRLKADPFAFYAQRILRLAALDPVDADPSAAWRGTEVHRILEEWSRHDDCRVDALRPRALAMLADPGTHPLLRALWQPRLLAGVEWIAETMAAEIADGRVVLNAEGKGGAEIAGVNLSGRYDRIDRLADGTLGIVDYKTGKAPSASAVRAGFAMQLGLLGAIAEAGGFIGISGTAGGFEYWSLAKNRDAFGNVTSPVDPLGKNDRILTSEFVGQARAVFAEAAARWLTGDDAFTAKLNPEYAPYAEYDQLMRRDEWYGRE